MSRSTPTRVDRRSFLRTAGLLGAAAALRLPGGARAAEPPARLVAALHDSLTAWQRGQIVLPRGDPRRTQAHNNWHVVPELVRTTFGGDQRRIIEDIVRANVSEDDHDRLMRSMRDDAGGLGSYSVALFEDDGEADALTFVLTGRHVTMRANDEGTPSLFDGPVFYGHAVEFNERPDHPGNVWWSQARVASEVFYALGPTERAAALVRTPSPRDTQSTVALQGAEGEFAGVRVGELAQDQQQLVRGVLEEMLGPYRPTNSDAVWESVDAHGGVDALHIAFYEDGDLPDDDGVWDRWRIEGPGLSCYFRGSPHVHAWLHASPSG